MSAQTNALKSVATDTAVSDNPVRSFQMMLEKRRDQMAAALPKHLSADRMIRLATTEFAKSTQLQKCSAVSIYGAIIQASQLGLEIGVLGQAYLVPYNNRKKGTMEAQFIPGYKGLISLARRSGEVTSIETHIVYEKDKFELKLGLDTDLVHEPFLEGDRGKPRIVYGVAKFKDGGHHFEWMSINEVNKIRSRSKASDNGPWVTDYEQMVRKTLIRRMANYLPMSIELSNALQISDAVDSGKQASLDGDFVIIEGEEIPETNTQEGVGQAAPPEQTRDSARAQEPAGGQQSETPDPKPVYAVVADRMKKAAEKGDLEVLDLEASVIPQTGNLAQQKELNELYRKYRAEILGDTE